MSFSGCLGTHASNTSYTLHSVVGNGGCARVFKASVAPPRGEGLQEDGSTTTDRRSFVACKMAKRSNRMLCQSETDNIAREHMLYSLIPPHPNVARLLDSFVYKDHTYSIVEYCQCGSLHDFLIQKNHFSDAELRTMFDQILQGCGFIHSLGLVHLDIKPRNIVFAASGVLKICDFGHTDILQKDGKRSSREFCGTPNYVSPEMISRGTRHSVGFSSDVWSLGVCMFTLLTGKPPFETKSVSDTCANITKNTNIPSVLAMSPRISDEARLLLESMLSREPSMRPSVEEIIGHGYFHKDQPRASLAFPKTCKEGAISRRRRVTTPPPPKGIISGDGARVAGWVDYRNIFGVAWSLSDGTVGIKFNDASCIVWNPATQCAVFHPCGSEQPRVFHVKVSTKSEEVCTASSDDTTAAGGGSLALGKRFGCLRHMVTVLNRLPQTATVPCLYECVHSRPKHACPCVESPMARQVVVPMMLGGGDEFRCVFGIHDEHDGCLTFQAETRHGALLCVTVRESGNKTEWTLAHHENISDGSPCYMGNHIMMCVPNRLAKFLAAHGVSLMGALRKFANENPQHRRNKLFHMLEHSTLAECVGDIVRLETAKQHMTTTDTEFL
jgi:serine/threonine protein kinase